MILIIREWLVANRPLIYFVYGLAFFVLGISIALQSRQYSRLKLARSLPWLAGFGILHALNEWADVFIPIQGEFLSEPIVMVLHSIHYIVLALSFTSLFQFGIELFRPFPHKMKWLRFLPMSIFVAWLIFPYAVGLSYSDDFDQWGGLVTSTARYGLCFPGAILSGLGFLRQAKIQLEPISLPQIRRTLKIAAAALFLYGVLSGLIVDRSFYFPASLINSENFTKLLLFPPPVFRSIVGTILAVAVIRALEVFNIETDRLIWHMEEGQVIANERERIARDLHDGALQQVYAAGLLAQSLEKKVNGNLKEEVNRLVSIVNEAIDQLRTFLPIIKPELVSIDLISAITPIIEKARRAVVIENHWELSAPLFLQPEQVSHLVAFTSEALSNVIRHSKSDKVDLSIKCVKGFIRLSIQDYGRGLPNSLEPGFGLRNMRDRARLLGAELSFESKPGIGTTVSLDVPMERINEQNSLVDC